MKRSGNKTSQKRSGDNRERIGRENEQGDRRDEVEEEGEGQVMRGRDR